MQNPELYYRPSGIIPLKSIFIFLLIGIPSAVICGVLYEIVISSVSYIFLDIVFVVLFGALAGVACKRMVRAGKMRNIPAAIFAGILFGAIVIYAKWSYWYIDNLSLLSTGENTFVQFFNTLMHPVNTWEMMKLVNTVGAFSIDKTVYKGIMLWILWGSEAGMFLYFAILHPLRQAKIPFSETGDDWMEEKIAPEFLNATVPMKELQGQLESGNFNLLVNGIKANGMTSRRWTVVCYVDEAAVEYFLEVIEMKPTKSGRFGGRVKPRPSVFVGNGKSSGMLRISKSNYEMLQLSLHVSEAVTPLDDLKNKLNDRS